MKPYIGTRLRPMLLVFPESSIKGFTLQYSVGVVKLSIERGFLVLRMNNWGRITVRYTE